MFPLLYHAHHSLHPEDIDFWVRLAANHPGPILELGCGTGRVLAPLARNGHRVFGLDLDIGMLTFLRSILDPDLSSRVFVFQGDFTNFHLATQFNLILMPCNTFSTLTSNERQATLACVRHHLLPGGVFAVSLPNPYRLGVLPEQVGPETEDIFPHPLDEEPVLVSSAWERAEQHFIVHWFYDHLSPDGKAQRLNVQVKHHLIPPQTYQDEMRGSGFVSLRLYGDFDTSDYNRDSPHLIILASRQP